MSELGKYASMKYGHPPFIDASCRREPDFENQFPTISAICRQGLFAPRLRTDDIVVYMTVKGKYVNDIEPNNKLIAILQVVEVFQTHEDGKEWYEKNHINLPSNCMIDTNSPYDFDHTAGNILKVSQQKKYINSDVHYQKVVGKKLIESWDSTYKQKVKKWKMLVRTTPLYLELNNPISLFKSDLKLVFGEKIPNTRNPKEIRMQELKKLAFFANVNITT